MVAASAVSATATAKEKGAAMAKGDKPWISASDHAFWMDRVMFWQKRYEGVVSWYPEKAAEYRKNGLGCLRLTQYLDPATRRLTPRTIVDDADLDRRGPELELQYEESKVLAQARRKTKGPGYVAVYNAGLPTLGRRR
ncbi:hypothetical protein ACFYPN_09650 [Streptomyces sp. NPDC005576]|uniref:hypothetical protein n=2 Tax=Streptomyces TaxID=1883 RepID=UPI003685587C